MAQVIDISLQKGATSTVDKLLDERGLSFFLKRGGTLPLAIDDRRIELAVELAVRKLGRTPAPGTREACFGMIRRRIIAQLAQALVEVGF